jgi:histidinol-phosphate aminotransferase
MILLASNENPLGMPESARRAAASALEGAGNYPDSNGTALKNALAARLDVSPEWLTLGSGSSEILELAAQVSLKPGEGVVYSQYGFIVYAQATAHAHAHATVVPSRDFGHDLDAMRAAIGDDTKLVFVANPNNPTGTFIDAAPLLAFLQSVPAHVTVLLDEAYTEYLSPAQRYDSIEWVRRLPNLIVARTFSKAFGLAGLRIGYGVSQPALTARMNAQRPRFNVTTPAQAAAVAALGDAEFLARTYDAEHRRARPARRGLHRTGPGVHPLVGQLPDGAGRRCAGRACAPAGRRHRGVAARPLRPAAVAARQRRPARAEQGRARRVALRSRRLSLVCSARYDDNITPEETECMKRRQFAAQAAAVIATTAIAPMAFAQQAPRAHPGRLSAGRVGGRGGAAAGRQDARVARAERHHRQQAGRGGPARAGRAQALAARRQHADLLAERRDGDPPVALFEPGLRPGEGFHADRARQHLRLRGDGRGRARRPAT